MPNITVQMGPAAEEAKKELIERLTKVSAEITKIPEEKFIVFIDEFPAENIGVGGKTLKEIRGAAR